MLKIVASTDQEKELEIEKISPGFYELSIEGPEYQGVKGYGVMPLMLEEIVQLHTFLGKIIEKEKGK